MRLAVLLLAWVVLSPGATLAQAPDSGRVDASAAAASDTAAAPLTPRQVLIRSAVLPGWGQWASGHRIKGVVFGVAAAGLASYTVAAQRDLDQVSAQLDDLRRQDPFSPLIAGLETEVQGLAGDRNTRMLYVALAITAAAVDAYVDAHLADFGNETDLALAPMPGPGPGLALACTLRF
ncbi:MAG: DUF5683 domain-containing protein [Planctomycetota bacterium]